MKLLRTYWPFIFGLTGGIYFVTFNTIGASLVYLPGDLGDTRFNLYLLEHAHLFFTGQLDNYWNASFMYPERNVISYSDNLLGTAPFYSVFRIIGCNRETSFQLWFILLVVLNYSACYFFLNYLFKNKYAAVLGAFVFAFSMSLQSQIGHAQTVPRFAIPLALWAGLIYIRELKPRYFFACVLLLVYQIYCGIYLGFMLSVPIAILLFYSLFNQRSLYKIRIKDKSWIIRMIGAAAINIFFLLALMLPYFERASETGFYSYEVIYQSVPTVKSFFFSCRGSYVWEFLNELAIDYVAFWDHQIFAGFFANLCLLVFFTVVVAAVLKKQDVVFKIDATSFVLFIVSVLTFILFIRFRSYSFYWFMHLMPGFGSMRALQRIINIELIFYAIAVAFVFKTVLKIEKNSSVFLFVIFLALVIADNYVLKDVQHKTQKSIFQERLKALELKLKNIPKNSIISYEPDSVPVKSYLVQLDAMLAAQSLGLRTLNGYSATSPKSYDNYWRKPNEESREIWLKANGIQNKNIVVIR